MDRGSILALLKMAVLTNEIQGRTLPQELADKVDAVASGDTSIDLLELMDQINDAMPDSEEDAIDYADVTFSGGNTARGPHFTVACPDGWTVVEDYGDSGLISQCRSFVIVRGEASRDDDLSLRDRIIYCTALAGDEEVTESLRRTGIELLWGLKHSAMYSMKPSVAWLEDVACSNGECVVVQTQPNGGINGLQFHIHPLTLASEDFVRLSLTYDEDADIEHARDFARKVAASIVIAEPFESETTKAMERADKGELSADEFVVLCQALFTSFRIAPQFMFEAKAEWYMTNGMGPNVNKAYLVGAEEIAAASPEQTDAVLAEAAAEYQRELTAQLGENPALDIAMFGMGPDAHFASLFPDHGEAEIDDPHVLVAGVRDSPKPPPLRLTLTVPMIARSKHTWVFTSEERKAGAVKAAFAQRNNPHAPSSYADGKELLWLIDEGAASKL